MLLHRMNTRSTPWEGSVFCHWLPIWQPQCMAGESPPVAHPFACLKGMPSCPAAAGNSRAHPEPLGCLPVSRLLTVLMPEAKFSCQGPYSAVLSVSKTKSPTRGTDKQNNV